MTCCFSCGGPWLISDARRGETMYDVDPSLQDRVESGIEFDGSNLSGVTSRCGWEELPYNSSEHGGYDDELQSSRNSATDRRHNAVTEGHDYTPNGTSARRCQSKLHEIGDAMRYWYKPLARSTYRYNVHTRVLTASFSARWQIVMQSHEH